jgi:hypothetical protein
MGIDVTKVATMEALAGDRVSVTMTGGLEMLQEIAVAPPVPKLHLVLAQEEKEEMVVGKAEVIGAVDGTVRVRVSNEDGEAVVASTLPADC